MVKRVYKVGINDANYDVRLANGGKCPYYKIWFAMMSRCYAKGNQGTSYASVNVCAEWLTFSNFRAWMETQDWEGKHLDKDLLGDGSIYSPETCSFINERLNSHIKVKRATRFAFGVRLAYKSNTTYQTYSSDKQGKKIYLGKFSSEMLAHKAWQINKIKVLTELALLENDVRVRFAVSALVKRLQFEHDNDLETKTLKGC